MLNCTSYNSSCFHWYLLFMCKIIRVCTDGVLPFQKTCSTQEKDTRQLDILRDGHITDHSPGSNLRSVSSVKD